MASHPKTTVATGTPGASARTRRRNSRRRKRRASLRRPSPEAWLAIARNTFGVKQLRPEQEAGIRAVLAGRDVLAVLPTGYGKSLIYQLPTLLLEHPVLVVSPLIALMRDQERSLHARRVPVVRLDSTLRSAARAQALARIRKGGRLIVLTTPETLESGETRPVLASARPVLLCVDEAHCISEWGHDFRPAYLRLGVERAQLGIACVLALTATATPRVRQDIAARLGMREPVEIVQPPLRDNLELAVEPAPGDAKFAIAARLLKRLRRPGIVYCATTRAVDEVHGALRRAGIPCARYHGKMKTSERNAEQRRFMKPGSRLVMVATSAFGMGIDKPDIRYILHFQLPGSLEQYVQEAGRAGRDGRPARCILLFDPADAEIQRFLQQTSRPRAVQLRRLTAVLLAWAREGKAVGARELALSAGLNQTAAKSLCAELEHLGLLERSAAGTYTSPVALPALGAGAQELSTRYETLRQQDERRLRAVLDYAQTPGCRGAFIRRWFGEVDPPVCGRCDRDRVRVGSGSQPQRRG